jgi:hypothetical protein
MAFRLAWRLYGLPLQSLGASANRSDLVITMPNQARWVFKTAEKPDLLYGEKVWTLVIDEASRCRDEAIHACWSTMTVTRGPIRMIGNVRGRHNLHYQWSRKGESGEPGFAYHRITADDAVTAGVFRREDVEAARSALPHAVFRELYYCEPSDDGANPFGLTHIAECVRRCGGQLSPGPVRVWGFDYARNTAAADAPRFAQSLFVLAEVISVRDDGGRATLDAGLKSLATDSGPPLADLAGWQVRSLSDEHTVLDRVAGAPALQVGDRVRLIPGHCDPTVNLHDWIVACRGDHVAEVWPVHARGAVF